MVITFSDCGGLVGTDIPGGVAPLKSNPRALAESIQKKAVDAAPAKSKATESMKKRLFLLPVRKLATAFLNKRLGSTDIREFLTLLGTPAAACGILLKGNRY
jgi:hypothetical protein